MAVSGGLKERASAATPDFLECSRMDPNSSTSSNTVRSQLELSLLSGFRLVCSGRDIGVPLSGQRLAAFLALKDRPLLRLHVASVLWTDGTEDRAQACLRSALWRIHQTGHNLVSATTTQVGIAPGVRIDLHNFEACARRVVTGLSATPEMDLALLLESGELLPDWYDDWVLIERERFRQLRIHALEALCEQLTAAGRHALALEAGMAAISCEPLRESAHRAVIRTHLAEGNACEALRQFRACRELLRRELGVAPSPTLLAAVAGLPVV